MNNINDYPSEWKTKCGIYCVLNLVNNKVYIGSSTELKMRWFSHRRELRLGIHRNDHLQKAWNKYGETNFCIEVLEVYSGKELDELADKENYWIKIFDALDRDKGYNIDLAGDLHHISEETRIKIGKSNTGHIHTEETKKRISQIKTGVKHTAESCKNMSIAVQKRYDSGWKPSPESVRIQADKHRGQKHTEETKQRLSEISKNNNTNKKSIAMMDKNGILVRNFNSISDAAKALGIPIRRGSNSHIVDAASGRKNSAYGYKWEYKQDII